MKRYVEGENRQQAAMFPERIDDYIGEDNPVRVVDAFVDELDLASLGFDRAEPAVTGRPGYHPAVMLKIYIYGYLNRISSSRRLERETQRNLELIWLTGKLSPDFKTIADFRKDNGAAIQSVCAQFVIICREIGLFANTAAIAIDGSKFKAVNNTDKNFNPRKIKMRIEQVNKRVGRYLVELDRADRQADAVPAERVKHLRERIDAAKNTLTWLNEMKDAVDAVPDKQVSLTDPDARSMATSGKGTATVGYNVQTAVDTVHHLIVAHDVNQQGHDRQQLAPMSYAAKRVMGVESATVLADRGYFSSRQIKACVDDGLTPIVPKPLTSNAGAAGRFDRRDFRYIAEDDEFECPGGERAIARFDTVEAGLKITKYWASACTRCPIQKDTCTTGEYRRITRWEHEDVLDAMQARLDRMPEASRIRRRTVEHPFGTLKAWMGSTHFRLRTLPKVKTEMSLHVLAYNMKRAISILGAPEVVRAIRARRAKLLRRFSGRQLPLWMQSGHLPVFTHPQPKAAGQISSVASVPPLSHGHGAT